MLYVNQKNTANFLFSFFSMYIQMLRKYCFIENVRTILSRKNLFNFFPNWIFAWSIPHRGAHLWAMHELGSAEKNNLRQDSAMS